MKVLMVCLGNICRSPLAEGILKDKIKKKNLAWSVDSAGTSSWHVGEAPHHESIAIAKKFNIDISGQRSRQFDLSDFDKFDLIIVMDSSNYADVSSHARDRNDLNKIKLLLNYSHPGMNMAVPDPYYSGGFDHVFSLIDEACDALISAFEKKI